MAEQFARPALELPHPVLGGLSVAAAPSAGQGLALDETGKLPSGVLRILTGLIASSGAITDGAGFTVTKNGTGDYTVTFSAAFASSPIIVLSNTGTEFAWIQPIFVARSASAFRINLRDTSNTSRDGAFSFFAMEVT